MDKANNNEVKYPRIVSTAPCNDDWFEGKSHTHIAAKIADVIMEDEVHGIIGIDGGWGSGKSNLVGLVEKEIKKRIDKANEGKKDKDKTQDYVFVTFDAWAHHTDYLRRSILEEFINSLIDLEVLDESWLEKIDMLLARVREIDTKKVVKLNELLIATTVIGFTMPIVNAMKEWFKYSYYVAIAIYIAVLIWLIVSRRKSMNKFNQKGWVTFFCEMYKLHVDKSNIETRPGYSEVNNKESEYKTIEFITEKEPTARQFRNYMSNIDDELVKKDRHVVLVIDNMDRLPIAKVKEIWSTIHAFFAEKDYKRIHTVIPFDRSHIINAFKEENIQELGIGHVEDKSSEKNEDRVKPIEVKSYGNDFINKTFYLVYRVSPPILTDWKDYFEVVWKEAFGTEIYKEHNELLTVFGKLADDFTPRSIIAFINECVTIYSIMGNEIPVEYLGLYIIGKEEINNNPEVSIMNPQFLGALEGRYDSEEMARNLSAIHYQIKKEKAVDVVFAPKVLKAIDEGDLSFIENFQNDRVLNSLLTDNIESVTNINNAIDFLVKISKSENANVYHLGYLWKNLFKTLKLSELSYHPNDYDEHHAILLEHSQNKKAVVDYFLEKYMKTDEGWKVRTYVEGIKTFRKYAKNEVDTYFKKHSKVKIKNEDYEQLLILVADGYKNYGLDCEMVKFDEYLSGHSLGQFKELEFLPILFTEGHKLTKTYASLCKLGAEAKEDKEYAMVFRHLREITDPYERQIQVDELYTDDLLLAIMKDMKDDSESIYDLIAMRIARKNEYPAGGDYGRVFNLYLSITDEGFVEKVAEVLPYYITIGDLMCSVLNYTEKGLICSIIKLAVDGRSSIPVVIKDKAKVLSHYHEIVEVTGVEPRTLMALIESVDGNVDNGKLKEWHERLFQDCKDMDLNIAKEINGQALKALKEISTEAWEKQILKPAREIQLWKIYKPQSISLKDGIVNVLKSYAETGQNKPEKNLVNEILPLFENEHYGLRKSLEDDFHAVLEHWTQEKMVYFTKWWFEWRVIDTKEKLEQMYRTEVIDKDAVVAELVGIGDYLNSMELPESFVEKMVTMAEGNRKTDEGLVAFCQSNAQTKAFMDRKKEGQETDEKV
jgi:hypothetical protein